jgi:beta-glucosidase
MTQLTFPKDFLWGTSTSAFQIETAVYSDWKGLKAPDGTVLERTIDHEKHRQEDAKIISSLGNSYRCSLDWSRLQRGPMQPLEAAVVDEYRNFLGELNDSNVKVMLVLHHFANPDWFASQGGWKSPSAVEHFNDYAKKMVESFGDLVSLWNTINEPTVYVTSAYIAGFFPPHKHNPIAAKKVLENMKRAHQAAYRTIKEKNPESPVGISDNTMVFKGENILGKVPARVSEKIYLDYVPDQFKEVDFIGLSYYGRVCFDPNLIMKINRPGKLDKMGRPHDDMWEYYPEGLKETLLRFHKRYGKPVIMTENGCCTNDDNLRIKFIKDHLRYAHEAIQEGVDLKGYYHWSTFDNWELQLGRKYRFGLVDVNPETLERTPKPSAAFYAGIARANTLKI